MLCQRCFSDPPALAGCPNHPPGPVADRNNNGPPYHGFQTETQAAPAAERLLMAELLSLFKKAVALFKNPAVSACVGAVAAKSAYVKTAITVVAAVASAVSGVK